MTASPLFQPFSSKSLDLSNRVVMAPMTRCRAIDNVPNSLIAEYYEQRADAGLIITEGTAPSPNGLGYARQPGLFTKEQALAWKETTDAVHASGGKIFVQLMHTGRMGHEINLPEGARVLAPSAVSPGGQMYTDEKGMLDIGVPETMTDAEVETAIDEFVASSKLAVEVAGFDGVELHGANGYLIEQFLNTASNQRTDKWGGSVENRLRFAIEVATRVGEAIGPERLAIRVSPYGANGGMASDETTHELYATLATRLGELGLAYIHVVDHSAMGAPPVPSKVKVAIRENFGGTYILSGGYDRDRANADLVEGKGDLVAFGRPFIANPDLVHRMKEGIALADANMQLAYSPGAEGYTDYATA